MSHELRTPLNSLLILARILAPRLHEALAGRLNTGRARVSRGPGASGDHQVSGRWYTP
jgi:hypothetical protein